MEEELNQPLGEAQKEVGPNKPNFSIMVEVGKDGIADINLKRKDGGIFSLNSLLAEGFRFKVGPGGIGCDITSKQVNIPQNPEELKKGIAVLNILHEVGHSYQPIPEIKMHKREILETLINRLRRKIRGSAKETPVDEGKSFPYKDKVGGFEELLLDPTLPISVVERAGRQTYAPMERDAWTFTLKNGRQLEKEAFNVFEGFSSRQIQEYVYNCLLTYEKGRVKLWGLRGEKAPIPPPIFVRPRKL